MLSINFSPLDRSWLLLLLTMTLVGCGGRTREGCDPVSAGSPNASDLAVSNPTLIPTPQDPEVILRIWEAGPHANTFIVSEDDTNSSCARCHAPLQWAPTSEEIPANWVENQIDPIPAPVLISELEWTQVDCHVCHATEAEQLEGNFSWIEIPPLETYAMVETSTQLCQKCHLETEHEGHHALISKGPHKDFLCTDCHDAHDTTASCSSSACHEPFANECESINTHDKPHSEVTCSACHDGGEPEIKWNEELLAWDTYRSIFDDIPQEYEPYVSHDIVLTVDCDRCHAPGDHPWDP